MPRSSSPNYWLDGKRLTVDARTDRDGRFTLHVPTKWLSEPPIKLLSTIWIWSPDSALETATVFEQMQRRPNAKPAEIILKPAQSVSFLVTHGPNPVSGAKVIPYYIKTPRAYESVPEPLIDRLTNVPDSEGRVTNSSISVEPLDRMRVQAPGLGVQSFRMPEHRCATAPIARGTR